MNRHHFESLPFFEWRSQPRVNELWNALCPPLNPLDLHDLAKRWGVTPQEAYRVTQHEDFPRRYSGVEHMVWEAGRVDAWEQDRADDYTRDLHLPAIIGGILA